MFWSVTNTIEIDEFAGCAGVGKQDQAETMPLQMRLNGGHYGGHAVMVRHLHTI
jgi:hypothetical protein